LHFFYIFSRESITTNCFNAIRAAKAKPTRLQGVQEGHAQVLFQARFNEARGRASNARAVFERIATLQKTSRGMIPHFFHRIDNK
jgi:hypothetical protein